MKSITLGIIFTLLSSAVAKADCKLKNQTPVDTTSYHVGWLWTISGNGLRQKSYLFGTCHGEGHNFTKDEVFGIDGVQTAFDRSEAVIFESDLNPNHQLTEDDKQFMQWITDLFRNPGPEYMMPEGTDYRSLLEDSTHFNVVDSILSNQFQDREYWKKTPKYWFVKIGLVFFLATRQRQILDYVLYQEAANSGKTCAYLEEGKDVSGGLITMFTDMPGLDTLSMKMQADSLYREIRNLISGETKRKLEGFYKAYIQNDTCAMARYLASHPEQERDKNDAFMLKGRNENWMPVIRENITQRPCMIAVGARHLMGSESLIVLLRREGYTVEPVVSKPSRHIADFEYYKNHLYLNGNVNGKPLRLVFDTGAPYTLCLDSAFVAESGLTFNRTTNARMGGAGAEQKQVKVILGSVTLIAVNRTFTPKYTPIINLRSVLGDKADGLFGMSGVSDKVLCIDFKYGKMITTDSISKAMVEGFEQVKIEQKSNRILIPLMVQIEGKTTVAGKALMDMGSGQGIVLTSKMAAKHHLEKIKDKKAWEYEVGGIGGHSAGYEFQAVKAQVGNLEIETPTIRFSTDKTGALSGTSDVAATTTSDDYLGLIGNKLWSEYDIILDLKNGFLYMKPN